MNRWAAIRRRCKERLLRTSNLSLPALPTSEIINGDCREVLRRFPDNHFAAVVTDPAYGLGFMNKAWDNGAISFDPEAWRALLPKVKPGGHLICFGSPRTHHRLMCAIEDAGFEIRDCLMWIHAEGFPKSHDIAKAIDKRLGAEREVIGVHGAKSVGYLRMKVEQGAQQVRTWEFPKLSGQPSTPEAERWQGYGTALK
jgi:DNA modification methylase